MPALYKLSWPFQVFFPFLWLYHHNQLAPYGSEMSTQCLFIFFGWMVLAAVISSHTHLSPPFFQQGFSKEFSISFRINNEPLLEGIGIRAYCLFILGLHLVMLLYWWERENQHVLVHVALELIANAISCCLKSWGPKIIKKCNWIQPYALYTQLKKTVLTQILGCIIWFRYDNNVNALNC